MVTVEIEAPAYGESCRQQRFPPTYGRRASCRLYREPCVGTREGVGEASVAARVGGAMEHRNLRERKRRGRGRGRRQHRLDREGEGQSGTSVSRNPSTHVRRVSGPGRACSLPAKAGALWERRKP